MDRMGRHLSRASRGFAAAIGFELLGFAAEHLLAYSSGQALLTIHQHGVGCSKLGSNSRWLIYSRLGTVCHTRLH